MRLACALAATAGRVASWRRRTMAGTFAHLRFSACARAPAELVARLQAFAKGRLTERAVARLEWPQVHGLSADDWALAGCGPSDFGLTPADASDEILRRSRAERRSMSEALSRWPLDAWHGLLVDFDIPPSAGGYPAIFGAFHWYLWLVGSVWHHAALVEYPTGSIGDDRRWSEWLAGFVAEAAVVFECECVEGTGDMFELG
jgi:hypothetical protein